MSFGGLKKARNFLGVVLTVPRNRYRVEDLAMSIPDLAQVQEEIQQNKNV